MNPYILKWFELMSLIHTSRPHGPLDAIVVHARSHGRDGEGLLEMVAEIALAHECGVIINGSNGDAHKPEFPGQKAWEGAAVYEEKLRDLSVPYTSLLWSEPATNTRDEAMVFAQIIQHYGWKRIGVANLGHCLPRAMLGWVQELELRNLSEVKLFPLAPTSVSWTAEVHGQQGSPPAPRIGQCAQELQRIMSYPTSQYAHRFGSMDQLIEHLLKLK